MCGRRTFLHGLCDKCAREDAIDRHQAAAQEPEADSKEVLEDADATLDPVITDESTLAVDASVVDPTLSASLRPAGTPVYIMHQEVSGAVSVFHLDETAWREVFVRRSAAPAHAMLWTGKSASLLPPVPPKSTRYL